MAQYFTRKKTTPFLLRFIYLINKFLFLKNKTKLNLYLDLEWIFQRLSHETAIKFYSSQGLPINKNSNDFLIKKINANDTILDLGCNLGEISFRLAQRAANVVGIDQNEQAITIAKLKHKLPNLKFINEEALTFLNSNNQKFEVLILSHILEHLDNPSEFLLKFKSYFKFIYIEVPDLEATILNQYRIDLESNYRYMDDDHLVEYDRSELIKMLSNCDLKIVDSEYRFGVQKYWCSIN